MYAAIYGIDKPLAIVEILQRSPDFLHHKPVVRMLLQQAARARSVTMICDPELRATSELAKVPMMQHRRDIEYFRAVEGTQGVAFFVDILVDDPPCIFEIDELGCRIVELVIVESDVPPRTAPRHPGGTEVGLPNEERPLLPLGELVLDSQTPPNRRGAQRFLELHVRVVFGIVGDLLRDLLHLPSERAVVRNALGSSVVSPLRLVPETGEAPDKFDNIGCIRLVVELLGSEDPGAIDVDNAGGGPEKEEHELMRTLLVVVDKLSVGQNLAEIMLTFFSVGSVVGFAFIEGILADRIRLALDAHLDLGPVDGARTSPRAAAFRRSGDSPHRIQATINCLLRSHLLVALGWGGGKGETGTEVGVVECLDLYESLGWYRVEQRGCSETYNWGVHASLCREVVQGLEDIFCLLVSLGSGLWDEHLQKLLRGDDGDLVLHDGAEIGPKLLLIRDAYETNTRVRIGFSGSIMVRLRVRGLGHGEKKGVPRA